MRLALGGGGGGVIEQNENKPTELPRPVGDGITLQVTDLGLQPSVTAQGCRWQPLCPAPNQSAEGC